MARACLLACLAPAVVADRRPIADTKGYECGADETVVAYHIHITFNGGDLTEYTKATRVYNGFKNAMDPAIMDQEQCPFGHPDCRGGNYSDAYHRICQLDDWPSFPAPTNLIFGASSKAFYVPSNHLHTAERWWRLHSEGVDWMIHACSGCEDRDHTDWTLLSYGYQRPVSAAALLCCHEGPPGCTCDGHQFEGAGGCLTANLQSFPNVTSDPTVSMQPCSNELPAPVQGPIDFLENGFWKVTYYQPEWVQIEVEGYWWFNTYACLTVAECKEGAGLVTSDCRGDGLTRMHPDGDIIVVDDCPGFCVDFASSGAQLVSCAGPNLTV